MAKRRSNMYAEASTADPEAHPIDDEVERRVRHRALRKQIIAAQHRVLAALGNDPGLLLQLEQLTGDRAIDREEAMFNLGYEQGVVQGRADALANTAHPANGRGRKLGMEIARLASGAGVPSVRALPLLLEVAWSLALGLPKPPTRGRRERNS